MIDKESVGEVTMPEQNAGIDNIQAVLNNIEGTRLSVGRNRGNHHEWYAAINKKGAWNQNDPGAWSRFVAKPELGIPNGVVQLTASGTSITEALVNLDAKCAQAVM